MGRISNDFTTLPPPPQMPTIEPISLQDAPEMTSAMGFDVSIGYASTTLMEARQHIATLTAISQAISELPPIAVQIDPLLREVADFITPPVPQAPQDFTPTFPQAPQEPDLTPVQMFKVGDVPAFDAAMPSINLDLPAPETIIPSMPAAPAVSDLAIPAAPEVPTLGAIHPLQLDEAPAFTAVAPVLNLDIAAPQPLDVNTPLAPALSDVAIPEAPLIELPGVPSLQGIVIPDAPALALPEFTAMLGDAPKMGEITFGFAEETYTSELLQTMRSRLLGWVQGDATGLEPVVEAAIWNRARDREHLSASALAEDTLRQFAARGFSRPPGALAMALMRAQQTVHDAATTSSREIAVKQAELEQANRRFAFETAWNIESNLIEYSGAIAGRALDTAKFTAQIGIEVFKADLLGYNAEVTAFTSRVEVFKALLQGELSRLEIFRAQVEAQRLVGDINQQQVALYTARVGAASQLVELFRANVSAAQATTEVQRTRIQAYAEEVRAYGERVRAKSVEYDSYSTQVRAEVAKAETFKVEADAFNSRVQGFTAVMNARNQQNQSEIEVRQRLPIEMFKARTEGFKNVIEGLRATTEVDRTRVQLYGAEVGAVAEQVRANAQAVDIFRARIDAEKAKVDTFRAQSDAHASQVSAYRASVDANVARLNSEIRVNQELPLEMFKARADGFDALVRAESARLQALGSVYETDGRVFDAMVRGESARVDSQTELFKAQSQNNTESARIRLEEAKANVERVKNQIDSLIDSVKAGAQLASQLAASALSMMNFSQGVSQSSNVSSSFNNSNSVNTSNSLNASYSQSYSRSDAYSEVESKSDNYSESHNYQYNKD
jgi:HAMP domain-containing protein